MNRTKKGKVILFIPNTRWCNKRPWLMLQQAPLILTALLKSEFDFSIIDANAKDLTEGQAQQHLNQAQPDAVLVSGLSTEYYQQFHDAMAMAKEAKPSCITIMGGVYPTVLGEEVIHDKNIDYIFIGHAEERVNEFLSLALNNENTALKTLPGIGYRNERGEVIINPVSSYISDVKTMVQPDYSLIDLSPYLQHNTKDYQFNSSFPTGSIITSYGCPYNCVFCATRTISGKGVAYRPVDDIAKEIKYLKSHYGVKNIVFLDDFFLAKRDRFKSLMRIFKGEKLEILWKVVTVSAWHLNDELLELMKENGCTQITISVESGSPRALKEIIRKPLKLGIVPGIVKKCNELGIDIGANFVIGFPGETWEELRETFRFAEKCNFDITHFHIATPLPKTDLYRIAKTKGLLDPNFSFTDPKTFGLGKGFITTDEFTPEQLQILRAYEWDRINFSTPQKTEKVAKMMCLTSKELKEHRKQTLLKLGIHY